MPVLPRKALLEKDNVGEYQETMKHCNYEK